MLHFSHPISIAPQIAQLWYVVINIHTVESTYIDFFVFRILIDKPSRALLASTRDPQIDSEDSQNDTWPAFSFLQSSLSSMESIIDNARNYIYTSVLISTT